MTVIKKAITMIQAVTITARFVSTLIFTVKFNVFWGYNSVADYVPYVQGDPKVR